MMLCWVSFLNPTYKLQTAALMAETSSTNLSEVAGVNVPKVKGIQPKLGTSNERATYPSSVVDKGKPLATASVNSLGSLKVTANESSSRPFKTFQVSSSQVTANQTGRSAFIVNVGANQMSVPHIATDKVSGQIFSLEESTLQIDMAQMSAAQINRLQVNPTQVNPIQENISEIFLPFGITLEQFLGINDLGRLILNSSVWHNSVAEDSTFRNLGTSQIGIPQIGTNQFSSTQISTSHVSTSQINPSQVSTFKINFPEIGVTQIATNQIAREKRSLQIGTSEVDVNQINVAESRHLQIGSTEIDIHKADISNMDVSQVNTSQISLSGFVTLNNFFTQSVQPERFLKFIHTTSPTSIN